MDWTKIIFDGLSLGLMSYMIHRLTSHIDKNTEEMKCLHGRVDIHDRVSSHLTEDEFDSHLVQQGKQDFPRVRSYFRRDD